MRRGGGGRSGWREGGDMGPEEPRMVPSAHSHYCWCNGKILYGLQSLADLALNPDFFS